ncbi:MAG: type II secretion system protein GspN [Deltaproteobacteria bacterium HGW-Deltaproteobacteria-4]|nr:MAG: type II secretion system protein GspN [Deltaproteobacteria bacterium HGW-Deltaproteobacteria-4]
MQRLRNSPWTLSAAGLLVTLVAFLCGFSLFFPAESLRPRLQAEAAKQGLRLTVKSLQSTFPPALSAKDVIVSSTGMESGEVKLERLTLAPAWSRLLIGKAAMTYDAALLGGRIKGVLQRPGPMILQGAGINWRGALPGLSGGTVVLQGCRGDLSAFWPAQADDALLLSLDCEQARIEGLFGAKEPLLLGSLTVKGSGKGKDLRLTTLAASGGQLGVDGSGTILLNEPLGRSLLNLNLVLRGNPGLDPTLVELLAAFIPPAVDGTSRLRLTGTLAAPQQSSASR